MINKATSFYYLYKYAERAKELIPTFINIKPSNREFYVLYNEAMKCWFYGLENSAVILSSTLLENTLKSKDGKINKNKDSRNTNLYNLINKFESVGVLSAIGAEKAHEIRQVRNEIVHQGLNIASSKALRLVRNSKDILEEIFN